MKEAVLETLLGLGGDSSSISAAELLPLEEALSQFAADVQADGGPVGELIAIVWDAVQRDPEFYAQTLDAMAALISLFLKRAEASVPAVKEAVANAVLRRESECVSDLELGFHVLYSIGEAFASGNSAEELEAREMIRKWGDRFASEVVPSLSGPIMRMVMKGRFN